jgi:hypothetical protein
MNRPQAGQLRPACTIVHEEDRKSAALGRRPSDAYDCTASEAEQRKMILDDDDKTVLSLLDRLSGLIFARDPAVVDELWSDLGFRLFGSEQGESAGTRDELAALFASLFSIPPRLAWAWKDRTVTRCGNLAWICAEGQLEMTYPDRTDRKPYRAICIFQKVAELWYWRLFSGSEPVVARRPESAAEETER